MPRTWAAPLLSVGVLCFAFGCEKERSDAPRVNTSGGHIPMVAKPEAGVPDGSTAGHADEDAGVFPLRSECKVFPTPLEAGPDPSGGRYVNAVDEPPDFDVTRSEVTWETSCGRPAIRVALSSGRCPLGDGHEVRFMFDATDIDNDLIRVGQNVVVSETESRSIRIRYVRPRGLVPSGEWGTCGEGASGGVTFRDTRLGTEQYAHFEALFQVLLPPCDGSDNAIEQLQGSFDVQLRRGLEDVCP